MLVQPSSAKFIDLIYAALLGESTWEHFLDELCPMVPNGRAVLFFHDCAAERGGLSLTARVPPEMISSYAAYYAAKNPWMGSAATRQVGRAVATEAILSREQLRRTEYYNDYLRPEKLASAVGVTIVRDENVNFMISVASGEADEAQSRTVLDCLQAIVPHLRRACEFYRGEAVSGQEFVSVRGAEDNLRIGVLRVGPGRKLRAYNAAAARLLQDGDGIGVGLGGRLRCGQPRVFDHIDAMLSSWPELPHGVAARCVPVPRKDGAPPLRLTILPPRTAVHEVFFRGPECTVLVEEPFCALGPAVEMMAMLHGLTSAERRVLSGLGEGLSPVEIARSVGVSPGTIRVQLKHIFGKTGAHRQVDLVRMLHSYAMTAVDLQRPTV